uniref:AAA+ ATPase domain-containing protein n=1 Tax=Phlebotomus papatasi TaxID=29031 RepID=A0A1B0DRH5_PHLPP
METIDVVSKALNYHYKNLEKSSKPLVMSFQGTSGIGKTTVSNVMKRAIYKKGMDSKFVHKFNGRESFTLVDRANVYKEQLLKTVRDAVKDCPLSLFVFDEVDKMPPGILEGITSTLDHGESNDNIDFTKAVFIFISNAGGLEISQHLATLMRRGESREDTQLHHFEKLTELSMYNSNGALEKSGTIENALIDHFIPFLPLEQRHVKKCIEQEFQRIGMPYPSKERLDAVLNSVTYEKENEFFAVHGCKKLEKKVGLVAAND